MRISVIMPALNEEGSVDATFATLWAQTRLPDEVVVADGGSSDATVARVRAWDGRQGVRVLCVPNPDRFCGGGRNAAAAASTGDLLVGMDFGNRADPRYLERMEAAFAADPQADYAGGPHWPLAETPFERAYAAILDHWAGIVRTMTPEQLLAAVDRDRFAPGGMNLAVTRGFFERSGGFPAWAGSCDDVLYGLRARHLGARILPVADAAVWYHMGRSNGETWRRIRNYSRWSARLGLQGGIYRNLLLVALATVAVAVAAAWQPWCAVAALLLPLGYVVLSAERRLARLARATARPWPWRERLLAWWLKGLSDVATVWGLALGMGDRLRDPSWPRRTRGWIAAPATA